MIPDNAQTRPSPAQVDYAALWLAEMWAPVREWQQTKDERIDAAARNQRYAPRQAS